MEQRGIVREREKERGGEMLECRRRWSHFRSPRYRFIKVTMITRELCPLIVSDRTDSTPHRKPEWRTIWFDRSSGWRTSELDLMGVDTFEEDGSELMVVCLGMFFGVSSGVFSGR